MPKALWFIGMNTPSTNTEENEREINEKKHRFSNFFYAGKPHTKIKFRSNVRFNFE